jgi:hypothetical protein
MTVGADPKSAPKFFDLVIIGGGINGAGIARDAADTLKIQRHRLGRALEIGEARNR